MPLSMYREMYLLQKYGLVWFEYALPVWDIYTSNNINKYIPYVYVPVNSSRIVLLCIFSTCARHALFVHAPLESCPVGDCTCLYLPRA